MVYRSGNMAVFLYGFAKNERDNVADDDLKTFREIGAAWLEAKGKTREHAIEKGILKEVSYDDRK